MKYALLVYPGTTQEAIGKLSGFEQAAIMTEYRRLAGEFGVERCVQFHPAETATTVRFEDGRRLILDAEYGSPDIGARTGGARRFAALRVTLLKVRRGHRAAGWVPEMPD